MNDEVIPPPAQDATAASPVAAAQPVAALPPIKTPVLKSFSLCDFRAFAGPEAVTFQLDGKNLLIYGENGVGKSSVFHALDEFFSAIHINAAARKRRLVEFENIFPNQGKGKVSISVSFEGDPDPVVWDEKGHPADTGGFPAKRADARVVNGSYRKAALDYRSLLETNFRHGSGQVNLFDVCVQILLRDYPVVHNGKEERLFDIWRRMEPKLQLNRMTDADKIGIASLTASFNAGIAEALDKLVPVANGILGKLGWNDVKLEGLQFPSVRFVWDRYRALRRYAGCEITPKLKFLDKDLQTPQTFLNEARLSALALAIYFAGREICAHTLQQDTPRLIVLDDVLIGLDQSNRLPVLDLLSDSFRSWQIVLLTHDRVWFEMARSYHRQHKADKFWRYAKIHSNDSPMYAPVVTHVDSSSASEALKDARGFLKQGHVNAAGNYARISAELALREFCEVKKVKVVYQQLPDKTPASDLLDAVKDFSKKAHGAYDIPLAALEMYTGILFNKLSHGGVPAVTQHEIVGAINAVDTLLFALKVMPTGAKPQST